MSSEVLGGVLRLDPDWDALPGDTPPHLTAYLKRCLEKEPRQRVHDIADVRLAMEGAFETVTTGRTETAIAQRGGWLPWSSGLALAVVSSLTVWTLTRPEPIPADVVQFTIAPTDTAPLNLVRGRQDLAFSPDGTQIVYTGAEPRLYLHRLDQLRSTPVRGGENGFGPFFSPDGSAVGFVDANQTTLQRVAVLEGSPVTVTESPNAIYGASWGADGQIIFGTNGAGLFRVPSGGGEPETLTTLDTGQGDTAHAWPFIIPGRDAVLFTIRFAVGFGSEQLAILELDTREVTRLGLAGVRPHYASTGHLVYATVEGWVRAMSFDASSLEVTGNSVPLVEGVAVPLNWGRQFQHLRQRRVGVCVGGAS